MDPVQIKWHAWRQCPRSINLLCQAKPKVCQAQYPPSWLRATANPWGGLWQVKPVQSLLAMYYAAPRNPQVRCFDLENVPKSPHLNTHSLMLLSNSFLNYLYPFQLENLQQGGPQFNSVTVKKDFLIYTLYLLPERAPLPPGLLLHEK